VDRERNALVDSDTENKYKMQPIGKCCRLSRATYIVLAGTNRRRSYEGTLVRGSETRLRIIRTAEANVSS
jgi:hypothetical protein